RTAACPAASPGRRPGPNRSQVVADVSAVVDIYDSATGQWSTAALSDARWQLRVATVGSKVLFAGGTTDGTFNEAAATATVDIYDAATGEWSTAALSQARLVPTIATVGTKALF